jgi:hypothetical protein
MLDVWPEESPTPVVHDSRHLLLAAEGVGRVGELLMAQPAEGELAIYG